RALAVHPGARGHGVARALMAASERLARESGAPVFAFHTASFMTDAIALYDRLGFRRAPEFDFDMAAHYGGTGATPITALAYLHQLAPAHAACA
ncbi:MAG TPA: GNAT family N-acetyltransferase, partial [Streptosporangiaceae bacterium]|nr:GNAT family N-acetyltransferase [Streptosporangiaceae bacterium]